MFAVCLGCALAGVTAAYRVHYGDQVIGTVRDKSEFETAKQAVCEQIDGETSDCLYDASYAFVLALSQDLSSTEELTTSILQNTDGVVLASALLIDGKEVAVVADASAFEPYKQAALAKYQTGAEGETVELLSQVETVSGYYPASKLADEAALQSAASALQVQTTRTETKEAETDFEKQTQKSSSQLVGYSQVITKGQKGLTRTTEKVTLLNGVETKRETVSTEVVKEPVDEVTLVGTKERQKVVVAQNATSAGFYWPVQRVARMQVSSYYGDGRNHKGVDIAAPAGTQIYAAKGGTVVTSTYSPSYGYYIVIDHGNGLKTLYAHASKLLVKVGETVAQGQNIALVGCTGIATGNHLHFEVHVNGVQVNPAPYIGL